MALPRRSHDHRGRRRKRRRSQVDAYDPEQDFRPHRRGRRERWEAEEPEVPRWRKREAERPVTCLQCVNLVIARSRAKLIGESWDNAVVYPSYSCYEQRWTVEDPDAVPDLSGASPYLVGEADKCPSFRRGFARDFRQGYW